MKSFYTVEILLLIFTLLFTGCEPQPSKSKKSINASNLERLPSSKPTQPTNKNYELTEAVDSEKTLADSKKCYLGIMGLRPKLSEELAFKEKGALIFSVSPDSPAKNAGLMPGDFIVSVNQKVVDSFKTLTTQLKEFTPGDEISIQYLRNNNHYSAQVKLASKAMPPDEAALKDSLFYLMQLRLTNNGPRLFLEIANIQKKLKYLKEAHATYIKAKTLYPKNKELASAYLHWLFQSGQLRTYIEQSTEYLNSHLNSIPILLNQLNALLATGKLTEAESLLLKSLSRMLEQGVSISERELSTLVFFWISCRNRQGKNLSSKQLDSILSNFPKHYSILKILNFWREQLKSESTFILSNLKTPEKIELKEDLLGFPHFISLKLNDKNFNRFLIDSGAAMSLLTTKTAQQADLSIGPQFHSKGIIGYWQYLAKTGFVKELKLGKSSIKNIPIKIGDATSLGALNIDGIIGLDLMHHVQVSINYSKKFVLLTRAGDKTKFKNNTRHFWDINIWPFYSIPLTQGTTPSSHFPLRIVFDTGNYKGSLVTSQWANYHLPDYKPPQGIDNIIHTFNPKEYRLKNLKISNQVIKEWPVTTMPPSKKELNQIFDLIFGYDLLGNYTVTIDMKLRKMRLESN